jgi:hypothetical protein
MTSRARRTFINLIGIRLQSRPNSTCGRMALGAILSCLAVFPLRAGLDVVQDGRSDYKIVIPSQSIPSEKYAAEELQAYLEKMTGAKLPIITDAETSSRHEIVLGETSRPGIAKAKAKYGGYGTDGFRLATEGSRLFITGGRPRGTLNGVYSLLEEQLGVRWFTPELEEVPKTPQIYLRKLNETKLPALEYREVFWTEMMRDPVFAARHRLNGQHYKLTEKQGGSFAIYFPFVHSFDSLIPPSLFEEHPEYFPMIDGKRVKGYVQRCLTNPDVTKLAIAKVREWIKEHPEATIISVSQNDTESWCHCPECKALDDREGSPAATMLQFVNAIGADIQNDYPNVRIDTLAYQYTRKRPKTLRPRANVIVRLCSIECCFAHPLADCPSEENRKFRDDIIAWQPAAPLLYVWDYTPNFAHYQQPFPNFDALQPNVQFFVSHGVKGLFEQGNYSGGGNGELGPLRAYLLAKLLWNPETRLKRHKEEFCQAYYGRAAGSILDYVELMEAQVRGKPVHAHIFDNSKAAYLNDDFLKEGDRILNQAEQWAQTDTQRFRVQVAHLPVWYVKLATNRVSGQERSQLLARFLDVSRKAGISNISEGQSLEDWAKKMDGKSSQ